MTHDDMSFAPDNQHNQHKNPNESHASPAPGQVFGAGEGSAATPDVRRGDKSDRPDQPGQRDRPDRPEGLPEKFWDADRGEVRTDALYKSYRQLEHRFGGLGDKSIPESHKGYQITAPLADMSIDPDVNARLHEAGFNQAQAQLVYDLAGEYLGPLSQSIGTEVASEMAAEVDRQRLRAHFGGAARWNETAAQLERWGRAKLGDAAVDELSSSFEGILRLHEMMQTDEPSMIIGETPGQGATGEAALKELMRDPRYWRDHDAGYVNKIKAGFEALYPESE